MNKQWVLIWKLPGPPKLRHFLWSVCKGSFATKHTLFNRYCVPSPVCERCNTDPETILHALCDCPNAVDIWRLFPAASVVCDAPRDSAAVFLMWSYQHASGDEFLLLCTTLWASWFLRNKEVYTTEHCDPVQLAISFHKLVLDFNLCASKTCIPGHESLLKFKTWNPPCDGWVKGTLTLM